MLSLAYWFAGCSLIFCKRTDIRVVSSVIQELKKLSVRTVQNFEICFFAVHSFIFAKYDTMQPVSYKFSVTTGKQGHG